MNSSGLRCRNVVIRKFCCEFSPVASVVPTQKCTKGLTFTGAPAGEPALALYLGMRSVRR